MYNLDEGRPTLYMGSTVIGLSPAGTESGTEARPCTSLILHGEFGFDTALVCRCRGPASSPVGVGSTGDSLASASHRGGIIAPLAEPSRFLAKQLFFLLFTCRWPL